MANEHNGFRRHMPERRIWALEKRWVLCRDLIAERTSAA
jgi:hypothetical protein